MGKVRIIYNEDETITVVHPSKYTSTPLDVCLDRATPDGAEYDDIDSSELPEYNKRYAWRGSKKDGIRIDDSVKSQESVRKSALSKLDALGLTKAELESLHL